MGQQPIDFPQSTRDKNDETRGMATFDATVGVKTTLVLKASRLHKNWEARLIKPAGFFLRIPTQNQYDNSFLQI